MERISPNHFMTAPNPYQPPRRPITPAAPTQYGQLHPFSARGRLGRLRYIGYSVGLGLLVNLLTVGWSGVVVALTPNEAASRSIALGGFLVLMALAAALSVLLAIQRLHDFDASGWWSGFALVPLANMAFYLVLLIMPGTPGANRFGAPPPPNTTGVILLALVLPLVFILGVITAIAIPAYQEYAERAAREAELNAPAQPQP